MIRPAKQLLLMMEVSGVTISDNLGIYGSLNFNSFLSLKCLVIARYQETGGVRDTRYLNLNLLSPSPPQDVLSPLPDFLQQHYKEEHL